jgi:replication factor A1
VLNVGRRSIRYQGQDQVIHEGRLADESGVISFTAWNDFALEAGDTVTAGNAGVREWDGEPELNLGDSTTVTKLDDPLEVPYDVGPESDLASLRTGDRGRTIEVAVVEVERRTIDGRDGETDILSGVFGDESGRLPFTAWVPHDAIENGDPVRVENAYVREFRGVPEVNVSEYSTVTPLDHAVEVGDAATELSIAEAVGSGGVYDVLVEGTLIAVRDGSGLIERCPKCSRVVQNGQCRSHGDVDGEDDLRVKAILDDGTATVTAILDADLTEQVYGGGLEEAKDAARDAMDKEVVADAIRDNIVGKEYRVRGHLSVDDYGANLDATDFDEVEADPVERAEALLAEVDA